MHACIALLRWFVFRLFMCLLVQHDSKWRHVSFWWDVHRLQVGDMSCLRMCVCVCLCVLVPFLLIFPVGP
jgi:hypothetical protein